MESGFEPKTLPSRNLDPTTAHHRTIHLALLHKFSLYNNPLYLICREGNDIEQQYTTQKHVHLQQVGFFFISACHDKLDVETLQQTSCKVTKHNRPTHLQNKFAVKLL
ncbi:hypothetical protein AVEN_166348-1 [Araneus ventricosus]|uniref:Uncharacterized protein n=1 Tax=Araneus ventricosus TaxID=182803 RepID=A0A4Y2TBC7_ARAVE|nr:hypothetical protein AVEN_166348-1 [Araneus ventricosus]